MTYLGGQSNMKFFFGFSLLTMLAVSSPGYARWQYATEKDPFSDQPISRAYIIKPGLFGASLQIRCKDGRLESYLYTGQYLGAENVDVRYRFGKSEPESSVWSTSTKKDSAFSDSAAEFARLVIANSSLVIEVSDFSDTPHAFQFSLAGSSTPVLRVLQNCKLPTTDPRALNKAIWRRVVQDIDALSVTELGQFNALLEPAISTQGWDGRASAAIYLDLSTFWRRYWTYCIYKKPEYSHCVSYQNLLKYDKDADFPVEPVLLALTYAKEVKSGKPALPLDIVLAEPED
jgi:hypothetical protein